MRHPAVFARRASATSRVFRAAVVAILVPITLLAPARVCAQGTRLDFRNAPVADVVRSLAAAIGLNAIVSDSADARISFSTAGPVSAAELPGILESILETHGLILVRHGNVAQVYTASQAPKTGQVGFGMDLPDPVPLGLVTQLVPLQSIRADEGAAALKPILSTSASVEPVARSNALLITDRGSNVRRYLEVLRRLDERPQGEAGLRTYVVALKYATADDLAESLGQLFGISVAASNRRNLDDLSLSRSLENFRQRETDAFRMRRDLPTTPIIVNQPPAAVPPAARDSGDVRGPGALLGQTTVVPHGPTNSLLIRTAPPNFPLLQETVQSLDVRPAQVLLEVTVAEVTLGTGDQFGVDWSSVGGSTTTSFGTPDAGDSSSLRDFAVRVVTLRNANVRAILRALSTRSQVKVLSTPSVVATNNRESRILVGSRVPFIASTRLGNDIAIDRNVQYEEVGTSLTIIPTINLDDYVSVQILQEVSSLTTQTIQSALNAPVISTREASTRAVIRDGQTVVIAGLIGTTREDIESGVPFLKDIPIMGSLFKRRSIARNRTEVAIFVTPFIVRSDEDADELRERVRSRMNRQVPGAVPDTLGTPLRKKPDETGDGRRETGENDRSMGAIPAASTGVLKRALPVAGSRPDARLLSRVSDV
ncbi:MAG: secretin N-terminal domain-containing protein [Gemmatimonadaceae bacterium]